MPAPGKIDGMNYATVSWFSDDLYQLRQALLKDFGSKLMADMDRKIMSGGLPPTIFGHPVIDETKKLPKEEMVMDFCDPAFQASCDIHNHLFPWQSSRSAVDDVAEIIRKHFPPPPAAKPAETRPSCNFTPEHLTRLLNLIGRANEYLTGEALSGYGCFDNSIDRAIDFLEGAWIQWKVEVDQARNDVRGLYAAVNGVRDQREAAERMAEKTT